MVTMDTMDTMAQLMAFNKLAPSCTSCPLCRLELEQPGLQAVGDDRAGRLPRLSGAVGQALVFLIIAL